MSQEVLQPGFAWWSWSSRHDDEEGDATRAKLVPREVEKSQAQQWGSEGREQGSGAEKQEHCTVRAFGWNKWKSVAWEDDEQQQVDDEVVWSSWWKGE